MERKYDIDESFGGYRGFTPPMSKSMIAIAQRAIPLMPKGIHSNKEVKIVDIKIPAKSGNIVKATLIEPLNLSSPSPCLLYIHGGGFVFGPVWYQYQNARDYALRANCKVLFVDYRLAPDNPYPLPNEDCYTAYEWLMDNKEILRIDTCRIAIGGDSAGGYLAIDLAYKLKEAEYRPGFLLLLYPVISPSKNTESKRMYTDTPMWNSKADEKMWEYYTAGKKFESIADTGDFHGFPETYIEAAEFDCLHDEDLSFAYKLESSGVSIEIQESKKTMHGFDIARRSPISKDFMKRRVSALRRAFEKAGKHW